MRPALPILGLLALPALVALLWACDDRTWRYGRPLGPPAEMPLFQASVRYEAGERNGLLLVRYDRSPSGFHLLGGPAFYDRRWFGWDYRWTPPGDRRVVRELRVDPLWAVVPALLGFAASVASLVHRYRRRRADRAGRCVGCGYDLRATPARCPECGWAGSGPSS